MLSFFNYNNVLVPTQYGFRHKRWTIHPTLDLITFCHDDIQNKNDCLKRNRAEFDRETNCLDHILKHVTR